VLIKKQAKKYYARIQWEIAVEYWSAVQCLRESTKRMNQIGDSWHRQSNNKRDGEEAFVWCKS
jgi:hypothetical protein